MIEDSLWKVIWGMVVAVYAGITGNQYARMNKMERRMDNSLNRLEDHHVTKDTFEAHMDAVQASLTANTKLSDANTRAIERLFETKEEKVKSR